LKSTKKSKEETKLLRNEHITRVLSEHTMRRAETGRKEMKEKVARVRKQSHKDGSFQTGP
jgi:hypothetical protein